MDFCSFCIQENPDIDSASQILAKLLDTHYFRAITHPKETAINTVINTLFGLV